MRTIVIFGGCGFIGKHLQNYLVSIESDIQIHICDIAVANKDEFHHQIDIRKPIQLSLPVVPDVIYNLAAVHRTPGHPDHEYFETNIRGAENVCNYAERVGTKAIVFTSSIAPYGASEQMKTEATLPTPNTPYGISKLVAEHIHRTWQSKSSERSLTIVRPGIVFGQGENGNFTRLAKALKKGLFAYAGRRDTRKAGIYVKDLVRVMDLMSKATERPVKLYNCCFEIPPTIEEIVVTMKTVLGVGKPTPTIPAIVLQMGASILGLLDSIGLGFHPDRVKKLMVSTQISGELLAKDYPLQYNLLQALQDWKADCQSNDLQ